MTRAIDSNIRPGVPIRTFLSATLKCPCGIVTSRRAYPSHKCQTRASIKLELEMMSNYDSLGNERSSIPRFSVDEVMRKLDGVINPGVPIEEFLRAVVQCKCGLLLTQRAFYAHTCDARTEL